MSNWPAPSGGLLMHLSMDRMLGMLYQVRLVVTYTDGTMLVLPPSP